MSHALETTQNVIYMLWDGALIWWYFLISLSTIVLIARWLSEIIVTEWIKSPNFAGGSLAPTEQF